MRPISTDPGMGRSAVVIAMRSREPQHQVVALKAQSPHEQVTTITGGAFLGCSDAGRPGPGARGRHEPLPPPGRP